MALPSWTNYGEYSSNNYGVHSLMFTDANGDRFWFSYSTLVAFDGPRGRVVHENMWGTTTGKHLNWIDNGDKRARVSRETFMRLYEEKFGEKLAA